MKKKTLLSLSIALVCASISNAQVYKGENAASRIQGAELVEYSDQSAMPTFIVFSPNSNYRKSVKNSATTIKELLKLRNEDQLIASQNEVDYLGYTNTRYQQYYKNIPVEGAQYLAHEKNGGLDCINGLLFNVGDVNTTPTLTEPQALQKALAHVGASKYMWEDQQEVANMRAATDDPTFNYDPKGELVIYPIDNSFTKEENFRLAYKFNIYALEPFGRSYIYVNAASGDIIGEEQLIHTADEVGSAKTKYSGTQAITTTKSGSSYVLQETGRGNGVRTFNSKTTTSTAQTDFTDDDNNWDNFNSKWDEAATDAHWATEMTYDYYKKEHNRNSIDNKGFRLINYVHWQVKYANAFWDGNKMSYGDGTTGNPLTGLDVGAHEMTHGLTSNSAGLVYNSESGALNESFSDIFGNTVEAYAKPNKHSWQIGEDINFLIRDMKNPYKFKDPGRYKGTYWATSSADSYGVHTNSGVQNLWYVLLCDGGTGTNDSKIKYDVKGIGMEKAAKIAFRNLTVYLTSNANYAAARAGSLKAATDIFGYCSAEYIATADAWYAVGVGATSGCTATAISTFDEAAAISVYPNPASDLLYVKIPSTEKLDVNVKIYTMLGNVVYDKKYTNNSVDAHSIDITAQPNGVYFVTIQYGATMVTKKIALAH
ncbi:MAG: M4 family metallopeptidase [Bacteroidia bacterium]